MSILNRLLGMYMLPFSEYQFRYIFKIRLQNSPWGDVSQSIECKYPEKTIDGAIATLAVLF